MANTRWDGLKRNPVLRGSLYYFGYWGVVGFYVPFLFVHFKEIGLSGT
ncbi:MAG: hypothetical protein RL076_1439, partial [Chloroflexota bacterium]